MPGSLWNFSLETYRRPGVQDACLELQDGVGADVNMLLYCCWRGGFADGEMRKLLAYLAPWQSDVVHGLRSVRRTLKPMVAELGELSKPASSLRTKIAALELEAEKLQHAMLSRHSLEHGETNPPSPQAAVQNLSQYFKLLEKAPGGEVQDMLKTLVVAAFPDGVEDDIKADLRRALGVED
ncbi:MAG: TIGR02444 family protein [Proteobacteria bacterium]|nr:TIGR02444 family protein [Pseudomonadota bacterium]MDA1354950.1 TIGR02444 family protein [Pseudomonadota bacterium]